VRKLFRFPNGGEEKAPAQIEHEMTKGKRPVTNKVMGRFRRAALPRSLLNFNLDSVRILVNGTCVPCGGTPGLIPRRTERIHGCAWAGPLAGKSYCVFARHRREKRRYIHPIAGENPAQAKLGRGTLQSSDDCDGLARSC
jgi:hypothetical protein